MNKIFKLKSLDENPNLYFDAGLLAAKAGIYGIQASCEDYDTEEKSFSVKTDLDLEPAEFTIFEFLNYNLKNYKIVKIETVES